MNTIENATSTGLGGVILQHPGKEKGREKLAANRGLDILRHVPDCFFKDYTQDLAKACDLPVNTAFMVGLGALSGVVSRAYAVAYPDGSPLPTGLYLIACQPPATAKTRLLKSFQHPVFRAEKEARAEWLKECEQCREEEKPEPVAPAPIFATNATPEALDKQLSQTRGFFALASTEQGLLRSLQRIGGENQKADEDLILKGFNGEFHSSHRVATPERWPVAWFASRRVVPSSRY